MGTTRYTGDITEGYRALELFTDRHAAVHHFASYLNDDPPNSTVLFFHGDGGNGKSLLLRYLWERCCKRLKPDNWAYVRALEDNDMFVANLEAAADIEPVAVARLDLGRDPRDAFQALLQLRRDLTGHHLHFPLFDFACVWYLHKSNQPLTRERLQSLFPEAELEFVSAIATLLQEIPGVQVLLSMLGLADRHLGGWFALYRQRRHVDQAVVDEIGRMDYKSELIDELPRLFAQDLNACIGLPNTPARIVLFFDAHEAFWGEQRGLPDPLYFQRDEWLRRLLTHLDRAAGIVAVVAGRDRPQWDKASRSPVPKTAIDLRHVSHLTDADALRYLERAGVADGELRHYLRDYARYGPDQVHPYYLGLCADLALAAEGQGTRLTPADLRGHPELAVRQRRLVHRLLHYLVDRQMHRAVRALSACRSFNREIHSYLGHTLDFPATPVDFDVLVQFSFVQRRVRDGNPEYRIHELLRRLLREESEDEVRTADQSR